MYKKLSEWQQERRDKPQRPDPRNTHGVDPTVWSKSAPAPPSADTAKDPIVELAQIRIELTEVNRKIRSSQAVFNGQSGRSLSRAEYYALLHRKDRLTPRLQELEMQCAMAKYERRIADDQKDLLEAQAVKVTLATVFMDMAKEMLADQVYQRIFIAAVHRHEDKK